MMKSTIETGKNGYKKTKLGWIPKDWDLKRFEKLVQIIMGQSPEGSTYNKNRDGIPLINGPTEFTKRFPVKKQWTTEPTKVCQTNDILICVRGSSTGRINISDGNYCIGRGVAAIRSFKNNDQKFIEYQLTNQLPRLLRLTSGSTFPNINSKDIKNLWIPTPPIPEQIKIAEILSTWDEAISKIEKLIEAKKRYKKGLMQRLLSGKFRFPEFKGEDWVEVRLKDITEVISSNLDKKIKEGQEEVLLCNYMDVYSNSVIDSNIPFMKSTASDREIEKYTLQQDDVIITKDSETSDDIASAAVVKNLEFRVLCGYHLAILRPKKGKELGDFLAKQIMTFTYRKQFFQKANGATRYGLRISDIESAKFQIPSLKEQKKISSLINCIDKEINILIEEKEAFEKQKNGLMQQLLTGKVRVNNMNECFSTET